MRPSYLCLFYACTLTASLLLMPQQILADEPKEETIDCSDGEKLGEKLAEAEEPTRFSVIGTCFNEGDLVITVDDITIDGDDCNGAVEGSIQFIGAQRGVVRGLDIFGPGPGVLVDHGASVMIEDSCIHDNGAAVDVYSPGIQVDNNGTGDIQRNVIENNVSDGIGVLNGGYAFVADNFISGNGRPAQFEAGIQVSRAVVRARGNEIVDNGRAALEIFNAGSYRTGTFISPATPDNVGPFEILTQSVGSGIAVESGQMSFVDLRQVTVLGDVIAGRTTHIQVRGDNNGSLDCSTIDGTVTANGFDAFVNLNNAVKITGIPQTSELNGGTVQGGSNPACP